MNEILQYALTQGAFCALFVWLLFDTRKDNKERETKYQETIDKNQNIIRELATKLNVIEDVKKDVEDIKNHIAK